MDKGSIHTELLSMSLRIDAVIADGRQALAQVEATQWRALALARFQITFAIDKFIAYKEAQILDPVISSSSGEVRARAEDLQKENRRLRVAYDDFIQTWPLNSARDVTESYRRDVIHLGDWIKQQIAFEIEQLMALMVAAER